MRYKKMVMLTIILTFLLAVSTVSAAENATSDVVCAEETTVDAFNENDDSLSVENYYISSDNKLAENDEVILSNGSSKSLSGGTFDDIQKVIDESSDGDVIELSGNYQSNGSEIHIYKNLTVIGVNGTVLDGKNMSGFFYSDSQINLILNGLTFIDSKEKQDAIILGSGQIINCNFINNYRISCYNSCNFVNCSFKNSFTVLGAGDVINCSFLNSYGAGAICGAKNIVNCSFVNNLAKYGSGAISDVGSVINCTFINNNGGASGAISGAGDVLNCKFINNIAKNSGSGAINDVGNVINCLFENNSLKDTTHKSAFAVLNSKDIINSIFINNSVNGSGSAVLCFRDIINCSFINNSASQTNYISNYEYQNGSIKNSNFVNTTIQFDSTDIENCTFDNSFLEGWNLNIGKFVDCNFINYVKLIMLGNTSIINCNFTGNGHDSSFCQLYEHAYIADCNFFNLNYIEICSPYPTVINSKFVKTGTSIGIPYRAKCFSKIINCSFENNSKTSLNLADGNASVLNCNFSNNEATSIKIGYAAENPLTTIKNCNFIKNAGKYGVVYGQHLNIDNCNFINNVKGAVQGDCINMTYCNFVGNSGLSAVCCYDSRILNCNFTKNSVHNSILTGYGGALDTYYSIIKNCIFIGNSADNGGAIRSAQSHIDGCTFKDNTATCHGAAIEIPVPNDSLKISNCKFSNNRAKIKVISMGYPVINYANSAIVKAGTSSGLKITNCTGLFNNDDKYKVKTKIVATTLDSSEGKYLKITFINTDYLNCPISGLKVKIKINSKTYTGTTNAKGQIKLLVDLPVKTYTAKITFSGNNHYLKSSKDVKFTITKTIPKLTAKAKTFKTSDKTKKYTATLKTKQNKVMKNTKVTIKVNKKTYTAKTNAKGVATFKLTKLTKKGKYTATVKYAGSKYYYAKSVNVKITVK